MRRFRDRLPVIVGGLLFLTSCFPMPVPDRLSGGRGGSLGWKVVIGKQEPNYVIATDRTICEVSPDRHRDARVGRRFFCHWR